MERRSLVKGLAAGAIVGALPTQLMSAGSTPRLGITLLSGAEPLLDAFRNGLEELGHVDGKNIALTIRKVDRVEQLASAVEEFVNSRVDLIAAASSVGGHAAQKATSTIPVVVIASHDGVGTGLFKSLARPGGNITGIDTMAPALDVKRVQILKQMLPKLSSLSVFYNPDFPGAKIHLEAITSSAQQLGIATRPVEVRTISDFDAGFSDILQHRPDAVIPVNDPLIFIVGRKRIIDFAAEHQIPMVHEFRLMVESGGLVSYGPDIAEVWRRGAYYVDKILKGSKPGDIPVERPTKFTLAINLKTAKALGLTFPNDLLATADVVIE